MVGDTNAETPGDKEKDDYRGVGFVPAAPNRSVPIVCVQLASVITE